MAMLRAELSRLREQKISQLKIIIKLGLHKDLGRLSLKPRVDLPDPDLRVLLTIYQDPSG